MSLNGVAISHEKVKGAVAFVQDFLRHPLFSQRNFFSQTGISMVNTAVTAADAVRHSSKFDPLGAIGVEAGPIIADLKSCGKENVSQMKAIKDTRERWFGAETAASIAVGEAAPSTTARISVVVEEGDVQYVEEHIKLGLFCCSHFMSNLGKGKKRRVPVNPVVAKKNFSLLKVRLLAVLHLKQLLKRVSRSRVREEVLVIAVMPQFSKGDINNNLIAYMYRLLAFEI